MDKPLSTNRKRGVALLVVVGLLALLMISSVAFVTMMRIERAGASNFRHAVSAREMVNVAVGRFLGDVDGAHPVPEARIDDDIYPPWTNHTWIIPGSKDASGQEKVDERETLTDIPEEIVFSVNPDRADAARAHVLSERMMDFVPGYFRPDVAKARPEWAPIEVDGRVVGRYAYIALNTSGMLDINAVASNGVERANGHDPAEIRIDGLSDVDNAATFSSKRDAIGGYMTLEQVAALGSASGLDDENLENFVPFSYIPNEELVPDGLETKHNKDGELRNPKLYIGGDLPSRLNDTYTYADGNKSTIKDRLWEILERDDMLGLNFEGSDNQTDRIQSFIDGLCDYIDTDDQPRNVNAPHVEATAMLSGISFVYDFAWTPVRAGSGANMTLQNGSKFTHEITVNISARNPFGTGTADYHAEVTLARSGNDPTINLAAINPTANVGLLTPKFIAGLKEMLLPNGNGQSWTVPLVGDNTTCQGDFTFTKEGSVAAAAAKVQQTSRMTIALEGGYRFDATIRLYHGSTLVDQVEFKGLDIMADCFNSRLGGARPIMTPVSMRDLAKRDSEWMETFDPRFNWIANDLGSRHMNSIMHWAIGDDLSYFGVDAPDFGGVGKWAEYIFRHPENIGKSGEGAIYRLFDGMGRRKDGNVWADEFQYQFKFPKAKNDELDSVGELALIPIAPYYTMRLYDHKDSDHYRMVPDIGYHRIYDFFTLRDPDSDDMLRGLVNPNSRQPDVMTAVYNQMPVDEWEATPQALTLSEARSIGDRVFEQLGGAAQDVSSIGAVDWYSILTSTDELKKKFCDDARREAVIRNAASLFSTRQQSFLVLLRADAFSTRFGQTSIKQGSVLSTAQAVALVWRDPVADEDGYHPCFIQMLKIIADDED